jgi:hypothetical protein
METMTAQEADRIVCRLPAVHAAQAVATAAAGLLHFDRAALRMKTLAHLQKSGIGAEEAGPLVEAVFALAETSGG